MFKVFEAKFSKRKFIESKNKDFKDSENSIKRTKKTSGFTMKRRDIMSEISINRFNSKSLRFVVKSAINSIVTNLRINWKSIRKIEQRYQLNFEYAEETCREQYHSLEFL